MCAFCGAANHVPLELLENYKPGTNMPLHELTAEHVRCGMCAGDLKYSLIDNEYGHQTDQIPDLMVKFYVGHKTLLD